MNNTQELIKSQIELMQIEPSETLRQKVMKSTELSELPLKYVKPKMRLKPAVLVAALSVVLLLTGFTFGEKIVYIFAEKLYPVEGYRMVDEIGECIEKDGYIINIVEENGIYTLSNVSSNNGETIFLKPTDAKGFTMREGEKISLYAILDTSADYSDKTTGELVSVGYYYNGTLYETFFGKLTEETFNIDVPFEQEFLIYITNGCVGIENFTELRVTYK